MKSQAIYKTSVVKCLLIKYFKEIFTYLRENGIFVRYFNKPRIDNFLRITIGTDEEMDLMLEKLSEICK